MNTDDELDLAHLSNSRLLFRTETEMILGCAFEAINEVGHGLHEKIYENALAVAFELEDIPFDQQRRFSVLFKRRSVGEFIPDFLVFDLVVVDPTVIDQSGTRKDAKLPSHN